MTRSIFDPTGTDTEHSGSRYLGAEAQNISHMPPDVIDGKLSEEEVLEATAEPDKVAENHERFHPGTPMEEILYPEKNRPDLH
jgi:hypothetical protein